MLKLLKYPIKLGSISVEGLKKEKSKSVEQELIYPETTVKYPEPATFEENKLFFEKTQAVPPMYVTKIRNGRCFTQTGFVLTENNKPVEDFTPHEIHPLKNKRHYKFQDVEKIEGNVAVLTSDSCQKNYYHWLIESASRIHLIEKSGFKVDKYLIDNSCDYQKRILGLLNIPEDKVLNIEPNRLIQADELIVPSIINYFDEIKTPERTYYNAKFIPEWVAGFYREKLLVLATEVEKRRLYIPRKKSAYRKVLNEDEVINFLKNYGFEDYYPEEHDLLEQVSDFYNAEIVISMHGAGLTNLMFCQTGTKIVEIFDEGYLFSGEQMLALLLGLDYRYFYSDPHKENLSPGFRKVRIDIDKLLRTGILTPAQK